LAPVFIQTNTGPSRSLQRDIIMLVSNRLGKIIRGIMLFGLITILGVLIFVAWASYYFQDLNLLSKCSEETLKKVLSPDAKLTASIHSRGCGATTGQVQNIFIEFTAVQPHSQKLIFSTPSSTPLSVSWPRENLLEINTNTSEPIILSTYTDGEKEVRIIKKSTK